MEDVAVRAPRLYETLRRFCLGAFAYLYRESRDEAPLPFAFEEHTTPGRPALYEYRPLTRGYVEARAERLAALDDAQDALRALAAEPAAALYARSAGSFDPGAAGAPASDPLFRHVLLPLLLSVTDACGGFEWDDGVFDRAYLDLEQSLFGDTHAYAAVTPLVGVSVPVPVELGRGITARAAVLGEISAYWPEARGLLPPGYGDLPERASVVELRCELGPASSGLPDAPGEIADAVTALRLATAAPVAAGPVIFERLDWRPCGVRPVLPIAGQEPQGEATRLDEFRGRLAHDLLLRLGPTDDDPSLSEALDAWEVALFAPEPARSDRLRAAFGAALGGSDGLWAAAARVAVLLGDTPEARAGLFASLRSLSAGREVQRGDADVIRRMLVEVLLRADRLALLDQLDESLLGLSPRPPKHIAVRAARAAAG